jgi:hypothetical protein
MKRTEISKMSLLMADYGAGELHRNTKREILGYGNKHNQTHGRTGPVILKETARKRGMDNDRNFIAANFRFCVFYRKTRCRSTRKR